MQLYTDLHSHLIPGIDDGVKSIEEALSILERFAQMGYRKVITTPHIMSHRYPNTKEEILFGLDALRKAVQDREIDISVEAASEYFMDEHFFELLEREKLLTFGEERYILFEISHLTGFSDLGYGVKKIIQKGYRPVLAHPERYLHMHDDFSEYELLKSQGVYFQLNINSLAGYYNRAVKKVAEHLVIEGMVDFLGSDVHRMKQLDLMRKFLKSRSYKKIFRYNRILNEEL